MKLYVLQLGVINLDANELISGSTRGTASNHNAPAIWIDVPVWGILIVTDEHKIVYDLGCVPDAMEGGWPERLAELLPISRKPEEYLEKQLALVGLNHKDIDTVVVSHLHCDHFGGIELFSHCDVYLPKEDWVNGLIKNHENSNPHNGFSYVKRSFETPVKQYHPIEIGEDFELFPGIEIITLPGHAPNVLGLMVHLEKDGTLIFPSDAISHRDIYGPPVKLGPAFNSAQFLKSIEKVRRLEKKYSAKVMISHDTALYATYKKAPDYYK